MTLDPHSTAESPVGGDNRVRPFRVLAVADSDSYLKFACATLDSLGEGWEREVLLVRSPILPTLEQIQAATPGTFLAGKAPRVIPASGLRSAMAGADVVLAAATGPVVEEVFTQASRMPHRPALLSALPGVAFPATRKALNYRALGDAFITHSHAECRAFSDLADAMRLPQRILVSRLPFLASPGRPEPQQVPLRSVVFAPQAKVPVERDQRVAILQALAALARRRPELSVRVKLRAWAGEPQTHLEQYPFDQLWSDLVAARAVGGHELQFCTGPDVRSAHAGRGHGHGQLYGCLGSARRRPAGADLGRFRSLRADAEQGLRWLRTGGEPGGSGGRPVPAPRPPVAAGQLLPCPNRAVGRAAG